MDVGALRWGREGKRPSTRSCRQIPRPSQVPAAADDLGRRGDVVLFQGEVENRAETVVLAQSVPVTTREEGPRRTHRTHYDAGQQLVQEQTATRSCQWGKRLQVGLCSRFITPYMQCTSLQVDSIQNWLNFYRGSFFSAYLVSLANINVWWHNLLNVLKLHCCKNVADVTIF